MSWHRQWHQQELRPEGPGSKLRQAMRQQMRDDDRRMMITPKVDSVKEAEPTHTRDPLTRPPSPTIREVREVPDIIRPKGWYLA